MGMIYETKSIAVKGSIIGFRCILRLKNKTHSCLTCTKLNNSTWWKHCRWPEQWKQHQLSFFLPSSFATFGLPRDHLHRQILSVFLQVKTETVTARWTLCSSANTTRWQHDFKVTLDTQIFKRLQAGRSCTPRHHNLFMLPMHLDTVKILISNNKK